MQNLILIIVIFLMGLIAPCMGQSTYEKEMNAALTEFSQSKTTDQWQKTSQHFETIAKTENQNWLPLYYAILSKTIDAFEKSPNEAIKVVDGIEREYENLEALNPNQAEALVLRALFRTVKVAKDPANYGMSLPSAILKDYSDALTLEPNNPRANFLMAEFNMHSAPYWGKDPKDYCPDMEKAKNLFQNQKVEGFNPKWGEERVDEILNNRCKS